MTVSKTIAAGEFKARCLELMDRVKSQRAEIVITKRGVPVAKLAPVEAPLKPQVFGCLRGSVEVIGDITASPFTKKEWAAFERLRDEQWRRWAATLPPRRRARRAKKR